MEIRGCAETRGLRENRHGYRGGLRHRVSGADHSVKIVDGLDEAIDHINRYSSHHTDAIVSENYTSAMRFLREVDSASVMITPPPVSPTAFEYGLGAEIGISTDKIHARGPAGLDA